MLRIVRSDRAVRLESASCPLDPLILSRVSRNRPLLPYDSVSKSTLGPHPPPIVPTWPDLGSDNAHFAQFWSKFGHDSAHFAQFRRPIISTLPNFGPSPHSIMPTLCNFGPKSTSDVAHIAQNWSNSILQNVNFANVSPNPFLDNER